MFFRHRKLLILLVLAVLALAVMFPTASMAQVKEEEAKLLLVGMVMDAPDEFIGLQIEGETATFYICDGNAEEGTVTIAQWFIGDLVNNSFDMTAPDGSQLEFTFDAERTTGKLTLPDGSEKEFSLSEAKEKAALMRSEFAIGGEQYVAGWIILEDGSVRGAIIKVGGDGDETDMTPASLSGSWFDLPEEESE